MNVNKADIVIISESNFDSSSEEKKEARQNFFPDYSFEDKFLGMHKKSRCTVMIHSNITYQRLANYEDSVNPAICLKIRDGRNKWFALYGLYRPWKASGDSEDSEGIRKQVSRLNSMCNQINLICKDFKKVLIGGDLNIDHCLENNPLSRPELKALYPIWEQCIIDNDLCQMNRKNTWHRPGKRSSLLDIFFSNCPNLIDGVQNMVNTLSEHDGVRVNFHTSEIISKPLFTTRRIYKNVTHDKLLEILDEKRNSKIQSIFSSQDPDRIASTILEELNNALKNLMVIKKEQTKKHKTPFWNSRLEAQRKQIIFLTKHAQNTNSHDDHRMLKHAQNRHSKAMRNAKRDFLRNKYETNLGKWKQLKDVTGDNKTGLTKVTVEGEEVTSPAQLADLYSEANLKKLQT